MSQSVGAQPQRTDYPIIAGSFTITSACLLIVYATVVILQGLQFLQVSAVHDVFWFYQLPSFMLSITFYIFSILGGVQALIRKRLLFAAFGTSILIPSSLGSVTFGLSSLALQLARMNVSETAESVFAFTIASVAFVLSVLSIIFLARSRHEFS